MLGQENIREKVEVNQMDVDDLSNGEQHYEDRLSSEIECKLSCEFQENPGPSCASSDSQHSESTSNESVMEIDNDAASGIKEAVIYFVYFFTKEFKKKINEYDEEAKPSSRVRKPSSLATKVNSLMEGAVAPGVHLPSFEPVSAGGKLFYGLGKKAVDFVTGNNHRQKAINVCEVIRSFKCNHRKVLAKASSEICQKFEGQFTKCMTVGNNIQERSIQKLAIDAIDRILSYASTNGNYDSNGNVEEAFFDFITKGVILGESKRATVVKAFHFKPAGSTVRDSESGVDLITSELYGNVGIKKRDDGVTEYYKLKKDDYAKKYGYRLTFGWELKNWQEVEQKYEFVERSEEEPESILDEKETKKLSSAALKKLDGQDLVTMKAMVDIKDHLRRQDEDRCHFSYCFNELAKFFIERKGVTKELNLKLHSKSQEMEMSRIVLIHGESGIGKTELVKGYGFSERRYGTWDKIMWIDALKYSSLKDSFTELAKKLKIPIKIESKRKGERDRDIESIVKDVYERLQYTKSFFVFDNASSYEGIKKFLPANSPSFLNKEKPFIVITCENDWQEEGMEKVKLNNFDPGESDEFLEKALEKDESEGNRSKLGKALNYHPLSLARAAANINQEGNSISSYLEKYNKMQKSSELQDNNGQSFGILKININKIKEEKNIGPQSYAMLEFMAYLNSYQINIKKIFFPGKSQEDQQKIWYALDLLDSYSLIHLKERIAQIHETTQEFMRLRQKEEGKEEETLRKIIVLLKNSNVRTTSHILSVWNHASKYKSLVDEFVNLDYHEGCISLHLLAKDGNEKVIRRILEKVNPDKLEKVVNATDRIGFTPLHHAIMSGHLGVVQYFIEKEINLRMNDYGIHCAVECDQLEIVQYFLDEGYFDLDEYDEQGDVPLSCAIKFDHLRIIRYLIEKGADLSLLEDKEKEDLFYCASRPGNLDIAQCLVKKSNGVNLRDRDGKSLLHYATMYGDLGIVKCFVEGGANINLCNKSGMTPLYYAVMHDHLEVVRCLMGRRADPTINKHAMHYAAMYSAFKVAEYFLNERHFDLDKYDEKGDVPLGCAIKFDRLRMVRYLIGEGANVHLLKRKEKMDLFCYASRPGNLDIVKCLVEKLNGVNLRDKDGKSLLHYAAMYDDLGTIEYLLESGADVNLPDKSDMTPLFYSVLNDDLDVIKYLIKKKAKIDIQDTEGRSPLHYAIAKGCLSVIHCLLEEGASLDVIDKSGCNALSFTTFNGIAAIFVCSFRQEVNRDMYFLNLDNVQRLVEEVMNVDQFDKYGRSLLHYAATDGNLTVVKYLRERRANIDLCSRDGSRSPLHYAAIEGNLDVVRYLVDKGANVKFYDKYGKNPSDYADENGHLCVANYLRIQEANVNLIHEQPQVSIEKIPKRRKLEHMIAISEENVSNRQLVQDSRCPMNPSVQLYGCRAYTHNNFSRNPSYGSENR